MLVIHPELSTLTLQWRLSTALFSSAITMYMTFRFIGLLFGLTFLTSCSSPEIPGRGGLPLPEGVQATLLNVTLEIVASGFIIPWGIEVISEEEYLFTERMGNLFYYKNGETIALDGIPETLTVKVAGLVYGGLMDVSLHPRFGTNSLVYIAFVNDDGRMTVARFNFGDRSVEDFEVIFRSNAFSIGSRIAWEDETHFFVTQGQGGHPYPEPGAQDLNSDGGKIHRLMADGTVPSDNPVFEGSAVPTSVWSYGHRDPQGLYFDSDEGLLYSTEHGPLGGDELNVIVKAGNFGWPLFSYGLNYDGTPVSDIIEAEALRTSILPLKYWDWTFNMAPSGLERLENSLFPEWDGSFVLGSLAQQRLIAYDVESDQTSLLLENIGRVRDVVQLPSGSLLILIDAGSPNSSDSGRIVKLTPRQSPSP